MNTSVLQTVGLQIANLDSDNTVSVAVAGTLVTDLSSQFTVSFGIGESSKLVTVKVTGNTLGDGDRAYTFRLVTDSATQIEGTVGGIRLNITDDDDEAAVLAKGASPESAVGQTEAGLQTGSVQIDSGATVTEGDNVDGVARMIIDVDILRADGSSEDVSSPGNYLSTQGRSPILESVSINYSVAAVSNDLVVTLNGSASAQERLGLAEALVRALNFFLPASDRDIGNSATVSIGLVPPSSAGNTTPSTQTYTISIAPENDTDHTFGPDARNGRIEVGEVDEDDEDGGASTVTILTGVSAVETGQRINGVNITGLTNPGLFRVAPRAALSGTFNNHEVMVSFTLTPNQFGDATFDLVIMDSGGNEMVDFTISVAPGLPDAIDGEFITIDFPSIAPGAIPAPGTLGNDYILVPGTGPMTGVNLGAAAACDSGNAQCDSVSASASVDSASVANPAALGSFGTRVTWTARNSAGDPIAVTRRTVYVAPPVGFDVGVVSLSSGEMSVDLPISVAVSSGAGSFSVGDLMVSGGTLASGASGLERTGSSEQLNNQIRVTGISPDSPLVTMTSVGGFMFTSEGLSGASIAVGNVDGSNERLFSIGNASVMLIERPRETPRAVVASSSFRETFSELFDDIGGQLFNRPVTTSDDISVPGSISVPESTTAHSGVYISDGSGIMLPGDSPPLSTEVTTAVGVDINIEVGVFDYAIDLSEPGDVAIALLRFSTVVQTPSVVYKYDPLAGSWGVFIATLITDGTPLVEGDTRHDRVYSAPAPDGQCPELSGSRQPDDDSSGGDHEYAWNLAVLGDNNVRVGDECLLMQIQDGSMNDADGAVEGTVFDPSGTVDDDDDDRGGGGAMSPIWLILLALAMMLPYGLRRRQSSPFISDF